MSVPVPGPAAPDVEKEVEIEKRATADWLEPYRDLQAELKAEMLLSRRSVPTETPWFATARGDYLQLRTGLEAQRQSLWVRRGSLDCRDELLIDLDALVRQHSGSTIGDFSLNPSLLKVAYTLDEVGDESFVLHVRDLATSHDEALFPALQVAWLNDHELVYTLRDDEMRSIAMVHDFSGTSARDRWVCSTKTPSQGMTVSACDDQDCVLLRTSDIGVGNPNIDIWSVTATELHCLCPETPGVSWEAAHIDGKFYVSKVDAKNKVSAFEWSATVDGARDVLSTIKGSAATSIWRANGYLIWTHGVDSATVVALRDHRVMTINPPTAGTTMVLDQNNSDSINNSLVFTIASTSDPLAVERYRWSIADANWERMADPLRMPENVVLSQVTVPLIEAGDPPVSTVIIAFHDKGLVLDATAPLLLCGYGAYGTNLFRELHFSDLVEPLTRRGFVVAYAAVRGGGELGDFFRRWGKGEDKINSFLDYIACAEALIDQGYARAGRIVAAGGSAGGMLVAGAMLMRPELFAGVIADKPMLDPIGILSGEEAVVKPSRAEFGDPRVPEELESMRRWAPLENIGQLAYPPMLTDVAVRDARTTWDQAMRFMTKLRESSTGSGPYLIAPDGHGHLPATDERESVDKPVIHATFALAVSGCSARTASDESS